MSHLAISLFGSFEVTLDGNPVTRFEADTARALLAYLALHANAPCRRETLAGLLWPDQPEAEARHNLRTALSRVRKAIGTDAERPFLLATRKTIQLDPEGDYWVDVSAFGELIATCQAHAHPRLEACPSCAQRLQEAVDLYQGDLLAGFSLPSAPFEEWLVVERERRHRQAIEALHHLAAYHTETGTYDQAQRYARRQLELEPWREVAHRQLMRALAYGGQRGAALRQYEECERVLQAELGVSPEEETISLYRAIQEGQERAAAEPQPERYELTRLITDKGSFGDTWLATDTVLEREVVIKCPKATGDPALRELFLTEARMLARLNHPNVVQIYDVLHDERRDCFLLVTEYVEGMDLESMFAEGYTLSLELIIEVAQGVLCALRYLHEQGVVHRDVKPGNIRITNTEPGVKLLDFNLAELKSILQGGTDYVAGTPAYMSPEQIAGRPVDGRADLYALGVILYQMVAGGRLPFEYADEDEMMDAHRYAVPSPLSQCAPTVPPALEQVVMRLLGKDPEERYPSAEAVLEALEAVHVGPGVSNLPVYLTPFVGREREMAAIGECLQNPDCRLLTLVGPGGIGKTHLAVEAALAQMDVFAHGVFFVALAPLQSPDAIVPTVAQALGFSFYEGVEPRQQLLDYLRQKSMLVVMDNFEHLLGGVDLVTDILKTAPDVRILAASRERLNVQGEHLFPVAGMDVPEGRALREGEPTASSAVRLFLHSARRVRPDFEPTEDGLAQVGRICRLVEGMPLGILLAASLMEMLTPAEIAAEIEQGIDVLETDLRDAPARQRSMRALLDHSWSLLTERQRAVLQALSIFRGGFTRQAAQAVTGAFLRDLMALTHKSLLRRAGGGRYDLWHELLRQYAGEKLSQNPDDCEAVRDRHCEYYTDFLHQREAEIITGNQQEILLEMDNVRGAWRWAIQRQKVREIRKSGLSLTWVYEVQGWYEEGEAIFGRAADALRTNEPLVEEKRIALGLLLAFQGRLSAMGRLGTGGQLVQESLSILRELDAPLELAFCNLVCGLGAGAANASEEKRLLQESLKTFREMGIHWGVAATLNALGQLAGEQGVYGEAERYSGEALKINRILKSRRGMAWSLTILGSIARERAEYTKARRFYEESLTLFQEIGYQVLIGDALWGLGDTAFVMREFGEAEKRYQEALAVFTDVGSNWGVAISCHKLGNAAMAVGDCVEAEQRYQQTLEIATDRQYLGLSLDTLVRLATLRARQGDRKEALELVALVLHHPANSKAIVDEARRLLNALRAEMTPDVFDAAQERGRARDLDATVKELLAELGGESTDD
jgi:predicted ATPase/DNA-binding SARP family transcriptional activator